MYSRYFVKCLSLIAAVNTSSALNAQTKISNSVLGNGDTPTGSSRFKISGTAGQAAIGVASSQSNVANSGFWVQAVDIVTEVEQQAGEEIPTRFRMHQNSEPVQPGDHDSVRSARLRA